MPDRTFTPDWQVSLAETGYGTMLSLGARTKVLLEWWCGNCWTRHAEVYNGGWSGAGRPYISGPCRRCREWNEEGDW